MHNFVIANLDTDSLMFSKPDGAAFTQEEQEKLQEELNSINDEMIRWEHDGYFPKVIIFKAKNYVLWDGKKLKKKGSGIVASTKEPALKEFIGEIIDAIINDRTNYTEIYHKYVREIKSVENMRRWVTRKTVTKSVLYPERTNEQKVADAIKDTGYVLGDRVYMFFKKDDSLCLLEKFDGDYNQDSLLSKLHSTAKIFSTVLDVKSLFPNYSLKRNQKALQEL